ncbi:hypothetical protein [Frigidibacter sp. MR17.24]|uniref:hypothetical protein n=1 Tax=Frigidibacter sp. MR17.24 TaxID=3127345 RepID=UPI0030130357
MLTRLLVFSATFFAICGEASAEAPRLTTAPFTEKVFERSEISGTLVVGISQVAGNLSEDLRISAEIPAGWSNLCLSVRTVDGLYESRNHYELPADWAGGNVIFDYPTAHTQLLLTTDADRIGTLVSAGSCDRQGSDIALSGWRVSERMEGVVRIFVNSFQADEVIAYAGDAPEVTCLPLTEGSRTAFDMVCDLELPAGLESPIEVELIRVRSGKTEDASLVSLSW